MSSSAGYGWSYVDQEAERRRQLRARLAAEAQRAENLRRAEARRAELRARLGELNEQAQGLRGEAGQLRRAYRTARVTVETVTVGVGADEAELTRAVERARAANARAAVELAEAVRDVWSAVLPEAVAEPERARPTRAEKRRGAAEAKADAEAGAEAAERARAEQAERVERVRAGALAEAQAVLDRDVPRCDPADLERVAGLVRALGAAAAVPDVRATLTDLAALVQHSVARRARDEERAELRSALSELAREADPSERDRLLADLAAAEDPAFLRPAVEKAVARADARRNRVPVAAALAEVLRERDYLVGEDFEDLLAAEGEVVVPFGDPDPERTGQSGDGRAEDGGEPPAAGYGLRLVLAPDRATLSTAVVRREDAGTGDAWQDEEQDESVQQWFCEEQLSAIEEGVRLQGVRLERTSAMAPGAMAAGLVPGGSWPPSAATPRRRRGKRAGTGAAAAVRKPQERGRER
ncbi:hypothetical protein SAMN05216371_6799 [Streptomyces sp. TLI_053]|uniref:hypothetical protein n=1 Tax=Streptomyces sp. TLI_053 TaxID=1855352 RepID=UPI00087D94B5|nr:hypothetical protein [Streptomyces sp. TLI_053]SDT81742.1 hypothetical protein SAMN05216371_6799 [Streptomyces sp. TLI_053]